MNIAYTSNVFFIAVIFSAIGIKFAYDGFTGDVPKIFTTLGLPDGLLITAGILCQVPTLLFVYTMI